MYISIYLRVHLIVRASSPGRRLMSCAIIGSGPAIPLSLIWLLAISVDSLLWILPFY